MRKKQPGRFRDKFPNVEPSALRILQKLLAFDAKDRPTAEEALADPYFGGLAKAEREPSSPPASKTDFDFERKKLSKDDVRELIYREILEYHPEMLKQHLNEKDQSRYTYPSGVNQLRRQFDYLQKQSKELVKSPIERKPASLPRERISAPLVEHAKTNRREEQNLPNRAIVTRPPLVPDKPLQGDSLKGSKRLDYGDEEAMEKETSYVKKFVKSASVSISQQSQSSTRAQTHSTVNGDNSKKEGTLNEVSVGQSRTKAMGSTVAKMVAAFTNGTTLQ
ncbi:hypothetical protein L7F22_043201 [Adiantum nelumboides]|nr:hypothetical protein [Adiantum nelumboides]